MIVAFNEHGWEDYTSWLPDRKILRRINRMIDEISRDPEGPGIGKAERLRESLSGLTSRRITEEHRLVYTVRDDMIIIVQARGHY